MRRTSWRISRILSPNAEAPGGDHPSGHTVAGYLERFTRRLGRAALEHLRSRTGIPEDPVRPSTLLRAGFT
ncbi:hypothetical protein Pd630_LPD05276 [Rhodococcus opacus PD630]|nr:hypothetical protein Pd630_LPD05276 [Rhodococcus opacus PD630]